VQQYCTAEWLHNISREKNQVLYKKGQYIFREGDRVFGLYFIQQGKVKIISTGINGKEQIVRLAIDGHIIGHRGYGSETYPIGAVALEDTRTCFLDNDILYSVFMNNPRFTYALMMFYAFELRKTEVRQRHLAQMSIREKVADTLIYLKEIFGMAARDKSLNIILSRQELADIAGTTSEQVTRELSDFENESLIKKDGKKIILLNVNGLNKIIAGHDTGIRYESWKKYDAEILHLSEKE
jgi:CRP-like cAMP-binding protein